MTLIYTNIDLAEFDLYTNILLKDNMRKTRYRQAIDNYTNNSKTNIIKILISKLKSKNYTNRNNTIPIQHS